MRTFYESEELKNLGLKQYGENVLISRNVILYNPERLIIGNNVRIDDFTIIGGKVTIGNYVHSTILWGVRRRRRNCYGRFFGIVFKSNNLCYLK